MNILYVYIYECFICILNICKEVGVVGGWTEIKRMETPETCLYMPLASLTTYMPIKREPRKGLLPNKNHF